MATLCVHVYNCCLLEFGLEIEESSSKILRLQFERDEAANPANGQWRSENRAPTSDNTHGHKIANKQTNDSPMATDNNQY